MPLEIIRNDIIKMNVDVIVNPTNSVLNPTGATDKAIHQAAGEELLAACHALEYCGVGEARITKGYHLPAKYVIHTVGPKWIDGNHNEEKLLAACYNNALLLAKENNLASIAMPLISSGTFGYPKDKALNIAIATIGEFLLENEMMIYLVVYDKQAFSLSEKLFTSIQQFIDDTYVEEQRLREQNEAPYYSQSVGYAEVEQSLEGIDALSEVKPIRGLADLVNNLAETFSEMLLRLIDEREMTDAETYKKANVDRRLFSKIRSDVDYKPSKSTVIAFAIALELSLDETVDLLHRAGFALSHSHKFDIIIEYFIRNENYNIFEINEALFAFEQNILGVR